MAAMKPKKTDNDTDINNVVVYDDSEASGEYYTLDDTWIEVTNHPSGKLRIGVGRHNAHKEIRMYIGLNKNANVITLSNNYKLFDRKNWIELRRKRGENKHKPLSVDKNGTIWVGEDHGAVYRVYIKR